MIAVHWLAQNQDFFRSVALLGYKMIGPEREVVLPATLTVKRETPSVMVSTDPTFTLTKESAESLMTALWEAGIRPINYTDIRGEIARMEAHIKDLQKVIWDPQMRGP